MNEKNILNEIFREIREKAIFNENIEKMIFQTLKNTSKSKKALIV